MTKFKFWWHNARPTALPQSILPTLLAICMAWGYTLRPEGQNYQFSLLYSLLALIGVICAHLCTNLLDDYFDYRNAGIEEREKLNRAGMRARIGKAPYLANGEATLKQTLKAACSFGGVALVVGLLVVLHRGWPIAIIMAAGAFCGFFYSAKPIALCYRGLGELDTGLMFGPLLMIGTSFTACDTITWGIVCTSVAVGLLVTNIVYTHAIMDAEADRSVGKQTLATLLKTEQRQMAAEWCFNFLPPILLIVAVIMKLINPASLLALLSLPIGITLYRSMKQFYIEKSTPDHTHQPYQRRWWMLNMENWEDIEKYKLDWFMYRWYLARNYITLFAFLMAIAAFL